MTHTKPYPPRAQFVEIAVGAWLQQGFESPDSVEFLSIIEHDAIVAELNKDADYTIQHQFALLKEKREAMKELERKLKIAEKALEYYADPQLFMDCAFDGHDLATGALKEIRGES